jgi:hypothetical protein
MEEKFRAEEMAQRNSEIEELLKSFKRDLESIEALNIEGLIIIINASHYFYILKSFVIIIIR